MESMSTLPRCTLRETAAFLRDPAVFTGGRGLELGDLYRVRIPGHRLHVVTNPALAEKILVRKAEGFVKSRLYWRELRRTIGDSMGSMDGERWRYLRQAQNSFFTPRMVEEYLPTVEALTSRQIGQLGETDHPLPVMDLLVELNARIILSTLFGYDEDSDLLALARGITEGHEIIAWRSKFPWRPFMGWLDGRNRRVRQHRAFFDSFVEGLCEGPGASAADKLLNTLMGVAVDPEAPPYSDSLLRNEVVFHLGAGTETLATAEGWALYLLWKHPDVLRRLRREIDKTTGGRVLSFADLSRISYGRQVMDEVLRLYPPVYGIIRDATRALELDGVEAKIGDTFLISVVGLHRSPRVWERAETFRPERFASGRDDEASRYQYIPFGAGKHVCIGRYLAIPAMLLTVCQIAQRFDWAFVDAQVRPEARPSLKPSGRFEARFATRS